MKKNKKKQLFSPKNGWILSGSLTASNDFSGKCVFEIAVSTRPPKLGGYSLGLMANGSGTMGHGGAWRTRCTVNWKKKQLHLWVVQLVGSPHPWESQWKKAVSKFFAADFNDGGTGAYTGRLN